jgi:hypothetical protein
VAAEAERIGNGDLQVGRLARDVRDVVEVALGVRLLLVDRRREDAVAEREDAERRLDRACAAEAVAGDGL